MQVFFYELEVAFMLGKIYCALLFKHLYSYLQAIWKTVFWFTAGYWCCYSFWVASHRRCLLALFLVVQLQRLRLPHQKKKKAKPKTSLKAPSKLLLARIPHRFFLLCQAQISRLCCLKFRLYFLEVAFLNCPYYKLKYNRYFSYVFIGIYFLPVFREAHPKHFLVSF